VNVARDSPLRGGKKKSNIHFDTMLLKHRDRELLHFEWVRPFGVRGVEINADAAQFLPLDLREAAKGGPVKVAFTGPCRLLGIIRNNLGLRKKSLAALTGLTERTVKRYLEQLKGKVVYRGAPKTGGYYCVADETGGVGLK